MPITFKRIITPIVLIALIYLIYNAAKIALADLAHYPIKHWIEQIDSGKPLSLLDLDNAAIKIQSAINLNPSNAEYQDYLARIYYLYAIYTINNDANNILLYKKYLIKSYQANKTAIKHRAQWPYSWSNLALIKAHLNQLDAEFDKAINNAVLYGAWEMASNEAIVQAGFIHWDKLSLVQKNVIVSSLERIYKQKKQKALELLINYQLKK